MQIPRSSRFGMHNIIVNRYFASLKKWPQGQDFMHFVRENGHDCFVALQYYPGKKVSHP